MGREGPGLDLRVPRNATNQIDESSGVTAAHGFDLRYQTPESMRRLGLPEDVVDTLTPYTGQHGTRGQSFVRAHPRQITPEQQSAIDAHVFNDTYRSVADRFNRDAANGSRFEDLPREAQTVIVDMQHQYGPRMPARTPNFWRQVTNGQWEEAYRNLQDFHDEDPRRRRAEGALLRRGIDAGAFRDAIR